MTIFVIFDDCPRDFGESEIKQPAYLSRRMAEHQIENLRLKSPYEFQYLKVVPIKVKTT